MTETNDSPDLTPLDNLPIPPRSDPPATAPAPAPACPAAATIAPAPAPATLRYEAAPPAAAAPTAPTSPAPIRYAAAAPATPSLAAPTSAFPARHEATTPLSSSPPAAQATSGYVPAAATPAPTTAMPSAPAPSAGVRRFNLRKLLVGVGIAAACVAGGYLLRPQVSRSAASPTIVKEDTTAQKKFAELSAMKKKLEADLKAAKDELANAAQHGDDLSATVAAQQGKIAAAELFLADLNTRLKDALTAGEPMRRELELTNALWLTQHVQAEALKKESARLFQDLGQAQSANAQLTAAGTELAATKASLEGELSTTKLQADRMARLLGAISFGAATPPPAPRGPAEMPITVGELTTVAGAPDLSFTRNQTLEMRWGKDHTAVAEGGVVVTIDAKPADRAALVAMASNPAALHGPAPARPAAADRALAFADLVDVFGKPARVVGTGNRFHACWPVGAWARDAWSTVEDGFVTSFDGKSPWPGLAAELAPQCAPDKSVGAQQGPAIYKTTLKVAADKLSQEAKAADRDGTKLTEWALAPQDSVGTWLGGNSTLVACRAQLNCTWTGPDGHVVHQQRYLIATFNVASGGKGELTECVLLPPRE